MIFNNKKIDDKESLINDKSGFDWRNANAIIQMMIISYNLWELYIYGHLHDFKKLGMTKIGYIENVVESIEQAKRGEIIFSSA